MSRDSAETTLVYWIAADHRTGLVRLRFSDAAGTEIAMDAATARRMAANLNQMAAELVEVGTQDGGLN